MINMPTPLPIQLEEQEALAPRDRMSVSEWAEAKRRLSPKTSDIDGPWSNDYAPFAVEIMDSLSTRGIQQTTLQKCYQASGTEIALNFVGWIVDEDPGPALMVMPTAADVKRRIATRVKPMFESSPSLLAHIGGDLTRINVTGPTETDAMILYLGWSTSPAALADNPICYVILDEVGKFPPRVRNEADPVSLAKARLRTFYARSSLYVASTPVLEGDLLDREYKRGDQRAYWVRCSFCKKYHVMDWFHNVEIDKDAEGHFLDEETYVMGGRARYRCPDCKKAWTETRRWEAVTAGIWAPDGCKVNKSGQIVPPPPPTSHRSYHVSAMMLHPHFNTIDRLAAKWADAQKQYRAGDIGPLQDFTNGQLGVPWTETGTVADEDILETHRSEYYEMGTVPDGVAMITAGFDVQLDHVWFIVVGWGWLSEAWIITAGRLETGPTDNVENYEKLLGNLRMTWPLVRDNTMVHRTFKSAIDCAYRPLTVQSFCRSVPDDIVPVRGDPTVKQMIRTAKISGPTAGDDMSKVVGSHEVRFHLNVDAIKDFGNRLMMQATPGPGYMHIPKDFPKEYISQLVAEKREPVRDGRGRMLGFRWIPVVAGRPNHLGDCFNYAKAAHDLGGGLTIPNPQEQAAPRSTGAVMDRYRRT